MYGRAAAAYRQVELETTPKEDIVLRLFGRVSTDITAAREAILARDIQTKSARIGRALQIVGELRAALDRSVAPELTDRLNGLYEFVERELLRASTSMAVDALDGAATVMNTLGDAFGQARSSM